MALMILHKAISAAGDMQVNTARHTVSYTLALLAIHLSAILQFFFICVAADKCICVTGSLGEDRRRRNWPCGGGGLSSMPASWRIKFAQVCMPKIFSSLDGVWVLFLQISKRKHALTAETSRKSKKRLFQYFFVLRKTRWVVMT